MTRLSLSSTVTLSQLTESSGPVTIASPICSRRVSMAVATGEVRAGRIALARREGSLQRWACICWAPTRAKVMMFIWRSRSAADSPAMWSSTVL